MNKNVLVTGGAQGIGHAITENLSTDGWQVYALDKQPNAAADNVTWITADLGEPTDVSKVIADLDGIPFHGLVNNAALIKPSEWENFDFEGWEKTMAINVTAALALVHGLRHNFVEGASIVNMSSVGGFHAGLDNVAYTTSKAALMSLTKSLAANLAPRVRVNAVAPGWVATESALPHIPPEAVEQTPLKRVAQPHEIANVVSYLLSDKAAFINGTTITVDGGFNM